LLITIPNVCFILYCAGVNVIEVFLMVVVTFI
jgi:hypothetical protein